MENKTKYYVDSDGKYIGGYEGEHGKDVSSYTEVPNPPTKSNQKWEEGDWVIDDLDILKEERYKEINIQTGVLLSAGFTYDGKTFKLTPNAIFNWNALKVSKADFVFPKKIGCMDNDQYSLTNANVQSFWEAGKTAFEPIVEGGSDLKKSIFDAVDEAAIGAIIDNR